ncbi:MAG: hypothetical protein KI786_15085, partial [Mameliella sp.]|nr:hypothetical protein [Phaeodactylibacter sp.]
HFAAPQNPFAKAEEWEKSGRAQRAGCIFFDLGSLRKGKANPAGITRESMEPVPTRVQAFFILQRRKTLLRKRRNGKSLVKHSEQAAYFLTLPH